MSVTNQPKIVSKIDFSKAPWTMHEFFAGSGLVAYGLRGMFRPVWSNDICPNKADVYKANFESSHFI
jgi:DNA (cytosine-5)-methyltransferase 1